MTENQDKPKDDEDKDQNTSKEKQVASNQQFQRGRELQIRKDNNNVPKKGRSAPPKQAYKPTGAIFGIDKPLPNAEGTNSGQIIQIVAKQGLITMEKEKEMEAKVTPSSIPKPAVPNQITQEKLINGAGASISSSKSQPKTPNKIALGKLTNDAGELPIPIENPKYLQVVLFQDSKRGHEEEEQWKVQLNKNTS